MNVLLSKKWDGFVKRQINDGHFASRCDVVKAALRLLEREPRSPMDDMETLNRYLEKLAATDDAEFLDISIADIIAQEHEKAGIA